MAAQVRAVVAERTPVLATRLPRDVNPGAAVVRRQRARARVAAPARGGPTEQPPWCRACSCSGCWGSWPVRLSRPTAGGGLWGAGVDTRRRRRRAHRGLDRRPHADARGLRHELGRRRRDVDLGRLPRRPAPWSLGLVGTGIIIAAAVARPGASGGAGSRAGSAPPRRCLRAGCCSRTATSRSTSPPPAPRGCSSTWARNGCSAARAALAVPALAGLAVVRGRGLGRPAHAPALTAVTTSAGAAAAAASSPPPGAARPRASPRR